MFKIKKVKSIKELKKVFCFLSLLFYDEACKYNEHYYTMGERFEEIKTTFETDNDFLMYIEDEEKIIAAITGKNIDNQQITSSMIGVDKKYRKQGIAKMLINEFEKRCKNKNIKHIDLGARFRACPLYLALNYKPSLMIQVFDFITIDEVKKHNKYNFKEGFSWQGDCYGFIFYNIDEIKE